MPLRSWGTRDDAWQGALNGKKIQIYITPGKEVCVVPHYSWLNGARHMTGDCTYTQLSYIDPLSRRKVLSKIAHVWVLFRLLTERLSHCRQGRAGREKGNYGDPKVAENPLLC